MLASAPPSKKGTTAQAASAGAMAITGPTKNSALLAPVGTSTSLKNSFMPSAMGCSNPHGPTRLGPMRTCIQPMILRSQKVR